MTTGERIKQRRLELGLSVDELANKLNKNRATIYRYENNDIENFPTTVLEPLSKVLETTPANLMGWETPTDLTYSKNSEEICDAIIRSLGYNMKATTADRLKEAMERYELRQVDILKRTEPYCKQYGIKMGRNDLSQYVSGKVSPGQEKLTILALALRVSEAWLMGYDVPMERAAFRDSSDKTSTNYISSFNKIGKSNLESEIAENISKLNNDGKKNLLDYSKILLGNPAFARTGNSYLKVVAAHERTDIEVTDEMRKHDNDIMSNPDEWK